MVEIERYLIGQIFDRKFIWTRKPKHNATENWVMFKLLELK